MKSKRSKARRTAPTKTKLQAATTQAAEAPAPKAHAIRFGDKVRSVAGHFYGDCVGYVVGFKDRGVDDTGTPLTPTVLVSVDMRTEATDCIRSAVGSVLVTEFDVSMLSLVAARTTSFGE